MTSSSDNQMTLDRPFGPKQHKEKPVITTAHSRTWITLFASLLLVTACSEKAPEKIASVPQKTEEAIPTEEKLASITRDELLNLQGKECEILPLEDVARVGDTPEKAVKTLHIMGCQYTWPKENADEILVANQTLVAEGQATGLSLMDIVRQQTATDNTVSLYLDTFFNSSDQDRIDAHFRSLTYNLTEEERAITTQTMQKMLNTVDKSAAQGLSEKHREIADGMLASIQQEQEKESFTTIEGIGVRAAWSDYSNRLVVQHRNLFFTLQVSLADHQINREAAKSLGSVVIGNLEEQL